MLRCSFFKLTSGVCVSLLCLTSCGADFLSKTDVTKSVNSATLLHHGAIFIESGAVFPGSSFLEVKGTPQSIEIGLRLVGDARFTDGSDKLTSITSQDGQVTVPAIVGGVPTRETTLYFDVPGQTVPPVRIRSIAHDAITRIKTYLSDNSGVILMGANYAVLDMELLHTQHQEGTSYSTALAGGWSSLTPSSSDCTCIWKFNVGELIFDNSCRGKVAMWVIPEFDWWHGDAFTPASAGITYLADGYKYRDQIYKISGSTCITISASSSRPYEVYTCINNLARDLGYGPPYPVPAHSFENEPPADKAAENVR